MRKYFGDGTKEGYGYQSRIRKRGMIMFCPNCGNQIKDDAKFCKECGWSRIELKASKNNNRNILIPIIFVVVILVIAFLIKNLSASKNLNDVKLITNYGLDTSIEQIGTIKFGSYPQSDPSGNKKEPIEWIVIDRQENKSLILSKYILDCKCYNDIESPVTWESCTLRKWLNDDFLQQAFNYDEQQAIILTEVSNIDDINEIYYSIGGNNTNDKVFLLSKEEIKKYFGNGIKEMYGYQLGKNVVTKGTNYARQVNNLSGRLKVSKSDWYTGNSYFWLRSMGNNQTYASFVGSSGYLDLLGLPVNFFEVGVRVALWVTNSSISKLSKTKQKNGWAGEYYYENGIKIVNDWKEYNGKWYYLKEDGKYVRNDWKKIGEDYYYFDSNGAMKENAWIDNEYYVGKDGKMLTNTVTPDGYIVGADGKYVDVNALNIANGQKVANVTSSIGDSVNSIKNLLDCYDEKNSKMGMSVHKNEDGSYTTLFAGLQLDALFDEDGNLWIYEKDDGDDFGYNEYVQIKYLNGGDSKKYTRHIEYLLRGERLVNYDNNESENMFKTYETMKDAYLKFKQQ